MNILIVEDDDSIRDLLCMIIRDIYQHECFACESISTCRCMLDKINPDIVFVDWKLKDGEGVEIIKMVRERYNPLPRIILISAARGIEEKANSLGVECLAKPFDLENLENIITDGYAGNRQT